MPLVPLVTPASESAVRRSPYMESEPVRLTALCWFESHGTIRIVSSFERVTVRGTEATLCRAKSSLAGDVSQGKSDRAATGTWIGIIQPRQTMSAASSRVIDSVYDTKS